jgi:hypothetical protein
MNLNDSASAAEIATSEPAPAPPRPPVTSSEAAPVPVKAPATSSEHASELRRLETEIAETEDELNNLRKLHREMKSPAKASPAKASSELLSGWKTCLD